MQQAIRNQIKIDLRKALKERRKDDATTLRSTLAEIDHAEAVPVDDQARVPMNGFTKDVARKELSEVDIKLILQSEIAALQSAETDYANNGQPEQAAKLQAAQQLLSHYI